MTMLHTHHGELLGIRGLHRGGRFSAAGVTRKIAAAISAIHRAIFAAKLHRLRNELMLRRYASENFGTDERMDVSRFPQRPHVLGEKWDH